MSIDGNLSGGGMDGEWMSLGDIMNPGAERVCGILLNRDSERSLLPGAVVLVVWNSHGQGKQRHV